MTATQALNETNLDFDQMRLELGATALELDALTDKYTRARETIAHQETEIEELREALKEISKGKGAYSQDPFQHACNTIEDMKQLAMEALQKGSE